MIHDEKFDSYFKETILNVKKIMENKGYLVLSAHIVENFGKNKMETNKTIVKRDLEWIDQSDICIFLFPTSSDGNPVRTDGTFIELGYAASKKNNILAFWNESCKKNYSPMFKGMLEKNIHMFDISQVKEVIEKIG